MFGLACINNGSVILGFLVNIVFVSPPSFSRQILLNDIRYFSCLVLPMHFPHFLLLSLILLSRYMNLHCNDDFPLLAHSTESLCSMKPSFFVGPSCQSSTLGVEHQVVRDSLSAGSAESLTQ